MKKRVVSLLLALVMLTSLVPTTVWAEDAYSVAPDTEMQDIRQERDNEGEQEDDPALAGRPMLSTVMPAAVTLTGSGSQDDPYLIGTAEELASLGGRSFSGKSYRLTQDIDMENVPMQPIKEFADGTFDGDGHTISNLTISAADGNAGLFAETNSSTVFKDIILHNVSVTLTGGSYAGVGGLIGFQSFINISVATNMLPNTGVPLPFISYGLTSLVSLYIGIGFVLNVGLQQKKYQ